VKKLSGRRQVQRVEESPAKTLEYCVFIAIVVHGAFYDRQLSLNMFSNFIHVVALKNTSFFMD
jgi:hypothetical protein